jgi:hypothetical protein
LRKNPNLNHFSVDSRNALAWISHDGLLVRNPIYSGVRGTAK